MTTIIPLIQLLNVLLKVFFKKNIEILKKSSRQKALNINDPLGSQNNILK